MKSVKLTFPQKLERVEIISAKDFSAEDYFEYIPLTIEPEDKFEPLVFDEEIATLRNIEKEKELFDTLDIPIQQTFYREAHFTDQNRKSRISLAKLPKDTILLSEAQAKIQEAYDSGFKEGQEITEDYYADEINKQESILRNFDIIVNKLRKEYSQEIKRLEESVVSLAIIAAEHIISEQFTNSESLVIKQVRKVLQEIDNETIFKISVNPKNIAVLEEVQSTLLNGYNTKNLVIEGDENIDIIGCVFETSTGKIDARLKTQLNKLQTKLNAIPLEMEQAEATELPEISLIDIVEDKDNVEDKNNVEDKDEEAEA